MKDTRITAEAGAAIRGRLGRQPNDPAVHGWKQYPWTAGLAVEQRTGDDVTGVREGLW
ncbi:MAG TPA: hypothetical protein VLA19_11750 [Herpetosiphonaceae bacterium]|nr:hypothetical protein [Herpetosiphonaceae bacterium]